MSVEWIKVSDRLPSREETGRSCPCVLVIMQCMESEETSWRKKPWQTMRMAELRFIGHDASRPIWCDTNKPHAHIENDSWVVTHWALPEYPEPIENRKFPTTW